MTPPKGVIAVPLPERPEPFFASLPADAAFMCLNASALWFSEGSGEKRTRTFHVVKGGTNPTSDAWKLRGAVGGRLIFEDV